MTITHTQSLKIMYPPGYVGSTNTQIFIYKYIYIYVCIYNMYIHIIYILIYSCHTKCSNLAVVRWV